MEPWALDFIGGTTLGWGLLFRVWAGILLRRAGIDTTAKLSRTYAPRYYVTEGPYAFTRHPMYWGNVLIAFGLSILLFKSFTIAIFLTWLTQNRDIGRAAEENELRRSLGQ